MKIGRKFRSSPSDHTALLRRYCVLCRCCVLIRLYTYSTTTELTSCQNSSWYEGIVLVNLGTVQRQLARTTVLCMPGRGPKMTSAPSTIIISSSNQIHYIVLTDHKTRITWPKITISHYQQLWGIQPSPQAATTATACRLAEPSLRYYERSNKPERSPSGLVVILANYS